jgi:hypothetical protein
LEPDLVGSPPRERRGEFLELSSFFRDVRAAAASVSATRSDCAAWPSISSARRWARASSASIGLLLAVESELLRRLQPLGRVPAPVRHRRGARLLRMAVAFDVVGALGLVEMRP